MNWTKDLPTRDGLYAIGSYDLGEIWSVKIVEIKVIGNEVWGVYKGRIGNLKNFLSKSCWIYGPIEFPPAPEVTE